MNPLLRWLIPLSILSACAMAPLRGHAQATNAGPRQPEAASAPRGGSNCVWGGPAHNCSPEGAPRPVKVLIITMFEPEATPWIEPLALKQELPVPGSHFKVFSPALV